MELIGKKVIHSKFGEGIVAKQEGLYISVSFGGQCKKFIYPDCFDVYLKIVENVETCSGV